MSVVDSQEAREDAETASDGQAQQGPAPEPPVDLDAIERAIAEATDTRLDVPSRAEIDERTKVLSEHARRLLREDYPPGAERLPSVLAVFRSAYQLLAVPRTPTSLDSDYTVWMYSRNLAHALNALLDVHRQYGGNSGGQPNHPPERQP